MGYLLLPAGKSAFDLTLLIKLFFPASRQNPSISHRALQQGRICEAQHRWARRQHLSTGGEQGEGRDRGQSEKRKTSYSGAQVRGHNCSHNIGNESTGDSGSRHKQSPDSANTMQILTQGGDMLAQTGEGQGQRGFIENLQDRIAEQTPALNRDYSFLLRALPGSFVRQKGKFLLELCSLSY